MNDISNNDLEVAIKLATAFHAGQVDKSGKPYILHPLAVMMSPRLASNTERAIAVLHDTLEDTALTPELLGDTMPRIVCDVVAKLTKTKGQNYEDYLAGIMLDPLATKIKLADIRHNISRLRSLPDEATARRLAVKYATALTILTVKGR